MANKNVPAVGGMHATLSSTTADLVSVPAGYDQFRAEVMNRDPSKPLYVRADGTTAVAEALGTTVILALQTCVIFVPSGQRISVVGDGNAYSVDHA